MQQAVPEGVGAMYAIIGLADDSVKTCCHQAETETGLIVCAVNFNSPGQVVIAGNTEAADKAAQLCKAAGAKRALSLAVSVPSHCALMQPAAEMLASMLDSIDFCPPKVPIINNVDVALQSAPEEIKQALIKQLYSPVRWTESVQKLASLGINQIYEIGPGKVLTGLIKRIDKSLSCEALNTADSISVFN